MNNVLVELMKVKSELTQDEINSAVDYLLKEKEQLYRNNVKEKENEIAKFEDEASLMKIKMGKKIGKIKIKNVDFPNYKLVKNIPKQSHNYVARENEYTCCIINPKRKKDYWLRGNLYVHPAITYDNKSDFAIKIGNKFFINEDEFIVIGENVAFKIEKIDGHYASYNATDLKNITLNGWFNSLLSEAYKRLKMEGEK